MGPLGTPEALPLASCVESRGLRGPTAMVSSPDGRYVYVSARGNSIAVFERQTR